MGSIDITAIPQINWSEPDHVSENGTKTYSVRCRVPFSDLQPSIVKCATTVRRRDDALDLIDTAKDMGLELPELRVISDDGEGILLPEDATGDTGSDDEVNWGDLPLMNGVASSTSVDFYGTEMSLAALKQMAVQMMTNDGIPYLPRHNNGSMGAVEWDEVIGRTVHAEVVPVDSVRASFSDSEQQYLLDVSIRMYPDEDLTVNLMRRVQRGEMIGQSIGGWFTELQVVQNDDGEVERVIVEGVELDHLAITRSPANPDSVGIVNVRNKLQELASDHLGSKIESDVDSVTVESHIGQGIVESMNERHIEAWQDNGDGTMTIVFALVHDKVDEEVVDEEMEEESYKKDKKKRDSVFTDLPMAPEGMSWSFTSEEALEVLYLNRGEEDPDWDRYKAAHAYFDSSNDDHESGYKLPIAKMVDGELHVVWRGVAAAMAALNGARGGVNIPETEREKVYTTLISYYEKFEKDPPELAEYSSLDTDENSEHHSIEADAGTSAPEDKDLLTKAGSTSEMSEEHAMTEEQLKEVLRTLLADSLAPLVERVGNLEAKSENNNEDRLVEVERTTEEAIKRAEEAERKLEELAAKPVRKGVAITNKATTNDDRGVQLQNAPTLSKSINKMNTILDKCEDNGSRVNRNQLQKGLANIFDSAAEDGIFHNTNLSAWK